MPFDYHLYRDLCGPEPLPAVLVDLDALDDNVARIASLAQGADKRIRVASKSVRVPRLLTRIADGLGASFGGLMCYSAAEAALLAGHGFDDLLLAYPCVHAAQLETVLDLAAGGVRITAMVDLPEHVALLEAAAQARRCAPVRVCVDLDMSLRLAGLHLGVQRSALRSPAAMEALVARVAASPVAELVGLMGYEAQVAGMGERNPHSPWLNPAKRAIKALSVRDVRRRRAAVAGLLAESGLSVELFNGGGTGSLRTTATEPWITEVTVGSGFLHPHLFDQYTDQLTRPAFCFGLRITRLPQPGVVTCQGGGFIASGEVGLDRQPVPFMPAGLETLSAEGFGEVQTPLKVPPGLALGLGDPVFFRPAKAGEIAERFDAYLLVRAGRIVERAPTYRGLGGCFH